MILRSAYSSTEGATNTIGSKFRRMENTRVVDAVQALALCHNVTPVYENVDGEEDASDLSEFKIFRLLLTVLVHFEPSWCSIIC